MLVIAVPHNNDKIPHRIKPLNCKVCIGVKVAAISTKIAAWSNIWNTLRAVVSGVTKWKRPLIVSKKTAEKVKIEREMVRLKSPRNSLIRIKLKARIKGKLNKCVI